MSVNCSKVDIPYVVLHDLQIGRLQYIPVLGKLKKKHKFTRLHISGKY